MSKTRALRLGKGRPNSWEDHARFKLRNYGVEPRSLELRSVVVHPAETLDLRSIKTSSKSLEMKPKAVFLLLLLRAGGCALREDAVFAFASTNSSPALSTDVCGVEANGNQPARETGHLRVTGDHRLAR